MLLVYSDRLLLRRLLMGILLDTHVRGRKTSLAKFIPNINVDSFAGRAWGRKVFVLVGSIFFTLNSIWTRVCLVVTELIR